MSTNLGWIQSRRTEAMRVLKAFQFVISHDGQVCPVDLEEGKDTMTANMDGMKKYLTNH
jgi:alkyl hydroperoxide reductase subunit AhpC